MSIKELAENKLILLYLMKKLDMPLRNLQITKVILENKIMNYFYLQQYLNELVESNFVSLDIEDFKNVYKITDSGIKTLEYFSDRVPFGVKSNIDRLISSIRKNIKNETFITADYTPESEHEFIVNCKVREDNFSLMDINIMVGTKTDVFTICENWKNYSQVIYSEIIESLIKKRD